MKKSMVFLVLLVIGVKLKSQNVFFERFVNVPYLELSNGTQISEQTCWKELSFGGLELPFDFKSATDTKLRTLSCESYGMDISNGVNYLSVYPLYSNIDIGFRDRNYDYSLSEQENEGRMAGSKVSYQVDGLAPNRIFKLEYKDVLFTNSDASDLVNLQIWLYESGVIEFHYGTIKITDFDKVFSSQPLVFISEEDEWDVAYRYFLEGMSDSPSLKMDKNQLHWLNNLPVNGMVYRFSSTPFTGFAQKDKGVETVVYNRGGELILENLGAYQNSELL